MNRHINDILKWKYLSGIISESEYFDGQSIKDNQINDTSDYDDDDDYVDLDLDDNFDYKYYTFKDFIESKYGPELSLEEKVKAVEEWATGYNVGENPGDFNGLAEFMTPELIAELQNSNVSQIFIDELTKEINGL